MQANAMGLMTGASDCILIYSGKILFLEIKTITGKQSDMQREFESRIRDSGFQYRLARSLEEAKIHATDTLSL